MPTLNANVTIAMREAVKMYAKAQSALRKHRVTISDVVVQALRNAGFEREDVLEALERGETPDIDVRTRTPAKRRPEIERVRDYIAGHGCCTELELQRNLHMLAEQVRRAVVVLLEQKQLTIRPFDRPVILHWCTTCKCARALPIELPK